MVFISHALAPRSFHRRRFLARDPFEVVRGLHSEMNRIFNSVADISASDVAAPDSIRHERLSSVFPRINLWSDDSRAVLSAEIPGVLPEGINLEVLSNTLTVSGRRSTSTANTEADAERGERHSGSFRRVVRLPFEAAADGVEASYAEGILTVKIPRAAAHRAQKIVVKG